MTNKEATSVLSALVTHYNAFSEESNAICKAIESLRAEDKSVYNMSPGQAYDKGFDDGLEEGLKVGACEDCVERQAVWDILQRLWGTSGELMDEIMALPSVTPAPKMGRWEYNQYDGNPNIGNWHCSECNRIIDYKPLYKWEKGTEFRYCPYCGSYNGGDAE